MSVPHWDDNEPDPLIVDALVQRYPVPGARPAERKAAALILYGRGWQTEKIGVLLREKPATIQKWLERGRSSPNPAAKKAWLDRGISTEKTTNRELDQNCVNECGRKAMTGRRGKCTACYMRERKLKVQK